VPSAYVLLLQHPRQNSIRLADRVKRVCPFYRTRDTHTCKWRSKRATISSERGDRFGAGGRRELELEYDEQSDSGMEEDHKLRRPQYYFQVTSIPDSEAPLEHRVAFVGKVFPLLPRNMDGPQPMTGLEVESGLSTDRADAVCVELRQAVYVLRCAGEEQAADYWARRVSGFLILQRSEVRIFLR
jgi:hypothetical protein